MAQTTHRLTGNLDGFIDFLDRAIVDGSLTGELEAEAEHTVGDARMVVRVYERYSAMGGNRLSLTVAALAVGEQIELSLVTSGGSQAMFWKVNTFGEEAFLDRAIEAVESYQG